MLKISLQDLPKIRLLVLAPAHGRKDLDLVGPAKAGGSHPATDLANGNATLAHQRAVVQDVIRRLPIADVKGEDRVELKFPFGKILTLHKVTHVPTIRRNILSGPILVREGFRLDCKRNKVVVSHLSTDVFYGKGYLCDVEDLFKLHVEQCMQCMNDDNVHSVIYSIESSDIWHERLGMLIMIPSKE